MGEIIGLLCNGHENTREKGYEAVMSYLISMWEQLQAIQLADIFDILIVAVLIYNLLPIFRSTGTSRIAGTVVVVLVITWLTGVLELHTLNFVLSQLVAVGLIAIVVLFQPELRRMLDHVSKFNFKKWLTQDKVSQEMELIVEETAKACEVMSREKIGALIVFARDNRLEEYFKTGTVLDAQVSEQLLRNVFFPKAALHDGAMIIRDGRVAVAGCVLPLSESQRLHADLGTRHRAAVGMSEVSDAIVVVVSEETGVISVAIGGMLKRHLAAQTLERLLKSQLCPEELKQEAWLERARRLKEKWKTGKEDGSDGK